MAESFEYALSCIVSYNGHGDWLMNLAEALEAGGDEYFNCPVRTAFWGSEVHCIWMLLVGMFGNWGTSIRGGWIEDRAGAARFIRELCKDELEDMVKTKDSGWKYMDGDA